MLKRSFCAALLAMSASVAIADMKLDTEQSSLYFTSIKNNAIAENHHFTALSGAYTDAGTAKVDIDLSSVETAIPIRNERMRDMLFKVAENPTAEITADIPNEVMADVAEGVSKVVQLPISLTLNGKNLTYDALLRITALEGAVMVTTESPILLNAADFGLDKGIGELQSVAALSAIATNVPVTATFVFKE
jgi:polyisoprenoid-binding protein YceI